METTVYGYKIPEAGDIAAGASGWMTAIEDNFERVSDHDHDGTDSVALTPAATTAFSSTVSSGSWSSQGAGMYRQTITVPAALLEFNNYIPSVYITSTGERIYPTLTRVTATTYYIYVNDNTLALTVKYR